jgi:hypothetical protein
VQARDYDFSVVQLPRKETRRVIVLVKSSFVSNCSFWLFITTQLPRS